MAIPSKCVITFPPDGWVTGAAPDGTATLVYDVETDPSTPVKILLGGSVIGSDASNTAGKARVTAVFPTTGVHLTKAEAGAPPDTLQSAPVTVTVLDMMADVTEPTDRSVTWYLNYLAGATVINLPDVRMFTAQWAACLWADVSPADFSYVGALNVKAGNEDRLVWVSANAALNLIAYQTTTFDDIQPWLTDQQALFKIAVTAGGV